MSIGLVECKRDRRAVVSVERIQLETAARIENRQATIGEPRKLPAVRTKRREIPERIEKADRVDQATTEDVTDLERVARTDHPPRAVVLEWPKHHKLRVSAAPQPGANPRPVGRAPCRERRGAVR